MKLALESFSKLARRHNSELHIMSMSMPGVRVHVNVHACVHVHVCARVHLIHFHFRFVFIFRSIFMFMFMVMHFQLLRGCTLEQKFVNRFYGDTVCQVIPAR
jgi:hypothetical protein